MEDRLAGPTRGGATALTALGIILLVTAGWWTLALWPPSPSAPEWLIRTRAACFGSRLDGLPDAGGWVLLIGEPVGLLSMLLVVWGDAVLEGLTALAHSRIGRVALGMASFALLVGFTAAATRVAGAGAASLESGATSLPRSHSRLDLDAPPLDLLNQHGDSVSLSRFHGRPVLLGFAYGHCQTVCPLIVHDILEARARAAPAAPAVLLVTLDPWRDTPQRLPHIARSWGLPGDAHVLGGTIAAVERTLDAWRVARSRDPRTGDIIHPAGVFVIDREGRIAYRVAGGPAVIAELVRRL